MGCRPSTCTWLMVNHASAQLADSPAAPSVACHGIRVLVREPPRQARVGTSRA
jgi:hypothetical protein